MKRIAVMALLTCLLLGGCGKGEIAEKDTSAISEVTKVNGFQFITEEEAVNYDLPETPDYFLFDGVRFSADDFSTREKLYESLERLNISSRLNTGEWQGMLQATGNTAKAFEDAVSTRLGECTFYFVPQADVDTDPEYSGLLGIRVAMDTYGAISADAKFFGDQRDSYDGVILCYEEAEVNVIKTSNDGLTGMPLGSWESEGSGVTPDPETDITVVQRPITDTMTLDTEIGDKYAAKDDTTYTGVIYMDAGNVAVRASDVSSMEVACDAVMRLSQIMILNYHGEGEEPFTAFGPIMVEELTNAVKETGTLYASLYEYSGGNSRIDFVITEDSMVMTVYPTGEESAPNTTVCYDTEYVPYVPYKFNHEMVINFGE